MNKKPILSSPLIKRSTTCALSLLFLLSFLVCSDVIRPFQSKSLLGDGFLSQVVLNGRISATEDCDYSFGKWVWDESAPLKSYNEDCPFLDQGFKCHKNGRRDEDFRKWRWQPHGCDIPRQEQVTCYLSFIIHIFNSYLLVLFSVLKIILIPSGWKLGKLRDIQLGGQIEEENRRRKMRENNTFHFLPKINRVYDAKQIFFFFLYQYSHPHTCRLFKSHTISTTIKIVFITEVPNVSKQISTFTFLKLHLIFNLLNQLLETFGVLKNQKFKKYESYEMFKSFKYLGFSKFMM